LDPPSEVRQSHDSGSGVDCGSATAASKASMPLRSASARQSGGAGRRSGDFRVSLHRVKIFLAPACVRVVASVCQILANTL
jgi:hypothetical protein